MLMAVFYMANIRRICFVSIDIQKMLYSTSRLNNNGQEYFISDSAHYLVRFDRGLTDSTDYIYSLRLIIGSSEQCLVKWVHIGGATSQLGKSR